MKKTNFIALIMGVVGGIIFGLGMCMCLLPEWNCFKQGIVVSVIGIIILGAMIIMLRKASGKPAIQLNGKAIATVIFGIIGALVLGAGMCFVMVWEKMVPGIIIGIVGIVLLLCLIPMCKGLK
ncbi:MAG: hypothetical protein ACI4IE_08305 [Eubacterium sp.]